MKIDKFSLGSNQEKTRFTNFYSTFFLCHHTFTDFSNENIGISGSKELDVLTVKTGLTRNTTPERTRNILQVVIGEYQRLVNCGLWGVDTIAFYRDL